MANNQLPKFHMVLYNYRFDITRRSVMLITTLVPRRMVRQCFVMCMLLDGHVFGDPKMVAVLLDVSS